MTVLDDAPDDGPAAAGAIGRRMLDFAREVVSTLDVERVLERVLEMARDLTDARYAALGVLDPELEHLERFLTVGIDEDGRGRIGALPRGHGVLGELIRDPRPLRLDDVGMHPRSYGFPVGHPPMSSFLGVPILIGGLAFGNLYLAEKRSGRPFVGADEDAVITLAGWAAVAIANARTHEQVARRRDELEQSVDGLSAMMDIALALGGETQVEAMLELVVKRGRALVAARTMAVALDAGGTLVIAATAGEVPPAWRGVDRPLPGVVAETAMRSRRPLRLDSAAVGDILGDGRSDDEGEADGDGAGAARGGLVVPLVFHDRPLGVLVALDRLTDGPIFREREEQLLQAFSMTAAAALATAHTAAADISQSRLLAAEAERNRWARELHDETLQGLAMLRMTLSAARRKGTVDVLNDSVTTSLVHIDEQIASLRGLIAELRPAALDDVGLEAALEAFIERAARLGGRIELAVDLDYETGRSPRRHPPELEATLYRIAQEGITNAVKHAQATNILVRLSERDGVVEVVVEDDGHGFESGGKHAGYGLAGMRERTALAGGTMTVTSTPGTGTRLAARLPVAGRRAAAGGTVARESPAAWGPLD